MFFERKLEVHIGKKELIDFIYVIIKEVNMEKKSWIIPIKLSFHYFFEIKKLWFDSIWLYWLLVYFINFYFLYIPPLKKYLYNFYSFLKFIF